MKSRLLEEIETVKFERNTKKLAILLVVMFGVGILIANHFGLEIQ